MIYNETFDQLFNELAGQAGSLSDYQRKRLRRAMLSRSLKPYFLEASWTTIAGAPGITAGSTYVASTLGVRKPLLVVEGAIRTTSDAGTAANADNYALLIRRTAGNSRVQVSQIAVRDEHILTPAQLGIRAIPAAGAVMGQGGCWPSRWPVPLSLEPNELIQITATILTGGIPAGDTTFCQFIALCPDSQEDDDSERLAAALKAYIASHATQRPVFLSMTSDGARSIAFPATGASQRVTARTQEVTEPLLVIGYAALFDRGNTTGAYGSNANPKWRLTSSAGHTFSKEEVDLNTYGYAAPGAFWRELPQPFLLPAGASLNASFSTLGSIANEHERIDNYITFRCVTV